MGNNKQGLVDYSGKKIKTSYKTRNSLLNDLKIKEHQLLDYCFPNTLKSNEAQPGIFEIQKWAGNKKQKFIYVSRTFTDWYRLSTKEEMQLLLNQYK